MRALTGAIVILAGSVLAGAGAIARALPRSSNAIGGPFNFIGFGFWFN